MTERKIELAPGKLDLRDYAATLEGMLVIGLDIKPLAARIEKSYPSILDKVTDPEVKAMLDKPDDALFLNLAAVCWGYGVSHEDLEDAGVMVPATLLYRAVADVWDDLYDPLVEADFPDVDPIALLNSPDVKKYFEKAYELMPEDDNFIGMTRMFDEASRDYVLAEAELADCSWTDGLEEMAILAKICEIRSRSFGQYAEALTKYVGKSLGRSGVEIEEVSSRMFAFAILGGFHDAMKDVREDGAFVTCASQFQETNLRKVEAILFRKVLEPGSE